MWYTRTIRFTHRAISIGHCVYECVRCVELRASECFSWWTLCKWAACVPLCDYVDTHVYIDGYSTFKGGLLENDMALIVIYDFRYHLVWKCDVSSAQPNSVLYRLFSLFDVLFWSCFFVNLNLICDAVAHTRVHRICLSIYSNAKLFLTIWNGLIRSTTNFGRSSSNKQFRKMKKRAKRNQNVFKFIFSLTSWVSNAYCIWIGWNLEMDSIRTN